MTLGAQYPGMTYAGSWPVGVADLPTPISKFPGWVGGGAVVSPLPRLDRMAETAPLSEKAMPRLNRMGETKGPSVRPMPRLMR